MATDDEEPFSDEEFRRAGKEYRSPQERRDIKAARESERRERLAYNEGRAERRRSTAETYARKAIPKGQVARTIVGTMAFTTLFALISSEVESKGATANGVRIILGGGVATVLLLVVAEAGDAGAELAQGLALVSLVTVTLVKGKPVWDFLRTVQGGPGTPSTPGTTSGPLAQPIVNPRQVAQASTVRQPFVIPTAGTGGT